MVQSSPDQSRTCASRIMINQLSEGSDIMIIPVKPDDMQMLYKLRFHTGFNTVFEGGREQMIDDGFDITISGPRLKNDMLDDLVKATKMAKDTDDVDGTNATAHERKNRQRTIESGHVRDTPSFVCSAIRRASKASTMSTSTSLGTNRWVKGPSTVGGGGGGSNEKKKKGDDMATEKGGGGVRNSKQKLDFSSFFDASNSKAKPEDSATMSDEVYDNVIKPLFWPWVNEYMDWTTLFNFCPYWYEEYETDDGKTYVLPKSPIMGTGDVLLVYYKGRPHLVWVWKQGFRPDSRKKRNANDLIKSRLNGEDADRETHSWGTSKPVTFGPTPEYLRNHMRSDYAKMMDTNMRWVIFKLPSNDGSVVSPMSDVLPTYKEYLSSLELKKTTVMRNLYPDEVVEKLESKIQLADPNGKQSRTSKLNITPGLPGSSVPSINQTTEFKGYSADKMGSQSAIYTSYEGLHDKSLQNVAQTLGMPTYGTQGYIPEHVAQSVLPQSVFGRGGGGYDDRDDDSRYERGETRSSTICRPDGKIYQRKHVLLEENQKYSTVKVGSVGQEKDYLFWRAKLDEMVGMAANNKCWEDRNAAAAYAMGNATSERGQRAAGAIQDGPEPANRKPYREKQHEERLSAILTECFSMTTLLTFFQVKMELNDILKKYTKYKLTKNNDHEKLAARAKIVLRFKNHHHESYEKINFLWQEGFLDEDQYFTHVCDLFRLDKNDRKARSRVAKKLKERTEDAEFERKVMREQPGTNANTNTNVGASMGINGKTVTKNKVMDGDKGGVGEKEKEKKRTRKPDETPGRGEPAKKRSG